MNEAYQIKETEREFKEIQLENEKKLRMSSSSMSKVKKGDSYYTIRRIHNFLKYKNTNNCIENDHYERLTARTRNEVREKYHESMNKADDFEDTAQMNV